MSQSSLVFMTGTFNDILLWGMLLEEWMTTDSSNTLFKGGEIPSDQYSITIYKKTIK